MNKSFWTKKAMALPVCAAIVVGGVALGATPAMADPADLSVTSQSVAGRVLTVNGTGTPGENIQLDASTSTRHAISNDGTWTITYTIPTGNDAAQTYTVRQTLPNGLNTDGTTTITAAPQVTPAFAINTHTVSGRTLTVTGTGTPGQTVQVDPPNGGVNRVRIGNDGSWTLTYQIPESAGTDTKTYSIFEQNNGFQTQAQGSFTAAAEAATPAPAEFSVTSPKNGDTVGSRTVTFTGTAQEGDQINLLDTDGNRLGGFDNIDRVGADQTWSLSVTFPDDAAQQQRVRVTDVRGGSGAGDTTITINLPAADTAPSRRP